MGLAEVGEEGTGTGQGKARHQVLCSKELHGWQGGERDLHTDWWIKVVTASPGGM